MAIDGVKIIDSDTAHDVYWSIMDLYDSGADLPTIEATYPLENEEYQSDALDFESEMNQSWPVNVICNIE